MDKTVNAVCITADIIGSRRIGKETELEAVAEQLNYMYKDRCITPFSRRMGDEMFGVLKRYSDGYRVLKDLLMISNGKDIPLYAGAGLGALTNPARHPHEVNGPAVWNAADAIKLLKDGDAAVKYFQNDRSTFKYLFYAGDADVPCRLLNYLCTFIFERIEKRTAKQTEIIAELEKHPHLTLEEIGTRVGYQINAASNVSKALARGEYHFIQGAEKEIEQLLDTLQNAKQV